MKIRNGRGLQIEIGKLYLENCSYRDVLIVTIYADISHHVSICVGPRRIFFLFFGRN
jgi:hypothetical protein